MWEQNNMYKILELIHMSLVFIPFPHCAQTNQ